MVDEELFPPSDAKMRFVGWANWDVAESGVDIERCSFSAGRSMSNNSVALRKGPPIAKELIVFQTDRPSVYGWLRTRTDDLREVAKSLAISALILVLWVIALLKTIRDTEITDCSAVGELSINHLFKALV